MVWEPNEVLTRSDAPVEHGERPKLVARLLQLQPQLRRRFEAAMPSKASSVPATLREAMATATLRQLEAVRTLALCGPLAMHELADRQGVTRSTATEVVDRLVDHGLVERRDDPADRRSVTVALTATAERMAVQLNRAHAASLASLIEVLDDRELATLVRLLEKLVIPEPPRPDADAAAGDAPSHGSAGR
ncbi:MAG TPA: MarR family transcriptional regulator [Verrucomicrobiae bacterium]|nr:MarR family transcriptional regulator [Verrucomicrobiae bacterium]